VIASASARTRIGSSPVQSFDHRNEDMDTGALRTIQKAGPSAETAGKTKRTATRGHEGGHGQVDEGVGVLDDPAHVGDAVEVEDPEVVDVDEGEGDEQEELRPLGGVAERGRPSGP